MKTKFKKGFIGILIFIAVFAVATAVVMVLWNALIPEIIGWTAIGYWQAAGLILLCRILLGGIGRGFHGRRPFQHHHHFSAEDRKKMHEKVKNMDAWERREYIRKHMFGNRENPVTDEKEQ